MLLHRQAVVLTLADLCDHMNLSAVFILIAVPVADGVS